MKDLAGVGSDVLWRPSTPFADTQMGKFAAFVNKNLETNFADYSTLYQWSIRSHLQFWEQLWQWLAPVHSATHSAVLQWPDDVVNGGDDDGSSCKRLRCAIEAARPMDLPVWFPGVRLNYAENLLHRAATAADAVALYGVDEGAHNTETITFKALRGRVAQLAAALRSAGVSVGDRVAGYVPNNGMAAIAMLATASVGAIWSSTSPDFGVEGVLDRFSQICPKILFSVMAVRYNNKHHDQSQKLCAIVEGLPKLEKVVLLPQMQLDGWGQCKPALTKIPKSCWLDKFLGEHLESAPESYAQLPFNQPLFILFSSGTTGAPKCITHSAGGTLLKHLEEHRLQTDLAPNDVMLYYATTGWMMWNWLLSGLACGAALVLYDGSPLLPDHNLSWDLVDCFGITVLGTSAKLLSVLEQRGSAPRSASLRSLRCILSTGSALAPGSFDYVYRCVKSDVLLGSITGGTDIIACFAGTNPTLPVRRGEIQAPMLGMAVECWSEHGAPLLDEDGELVCTKPFPSQPIGFWNDPTGARYRAAYFERFPGSGVWAHGDYCRLVSAAAGQAPPGLVMLGRCDGTLNPGGVRFGSAEIYSVMEAVPELADCLCVGQYSASALDERVILFVLMSAGHTFSTELVSRLKTLIRTRLSPRHVPAVVLPCSDIPYTRSNKKVELAVRHVIEGKPVTNRNVLRNPKALDLFKDLPELSNF